jgi:hypothetical protein
LSTTISAVVDLLDSGDQNGAAEQLRALAQEERLSGRSAQLRKLADDLSSDTSLERWAEIDLYAAFLRDDTVEARSRSGIRGGLGTVLDLMPAVLIFLPIVITWYGLYHATLAYRQSRGDPDLAGKSFLEQWQTGFDQRLSERLYFDRIALWTLLGVGVLVAVSLVQAVIRRRSDRMDAHESAELMRRLAAALTAADFQLSRYRVNDASRFTLGSQQLIDAADRMVKAGETARAIQQEAHESLRETRESLNRVKELADALLSGEKSVRDAGRQVSDAMTGVGARLDGIVAATGSVSEAAAELTRSTNADSANLRRAVQQAVTDSAAEIRTAVGESQRELGTRIGGALDSSGANIRQALDDWRIEGQIYSHRHETTADQLGLIVGSIEQLMDRIERALGHLPATVDKFEEHSDQAAQRLEHNMTEAADRLKKQLDRFLVGLPDAQSRTDQVTTQMAALQRSMDQLRDQLGRPLGRPAGRKRWFRRWFG